MHNFAKEPTHWKKEKKKWFTSMRDDVEIEKLRDCEEYISIGGLRWFNHQTIKKKSDTPIDWDCENLFFVSLVFLGTK